MAHEDNPQLAIPYEITDVRRANHAIRLDPGMDQQIYFHNGLAQTVTVVYRNGISITIPPSTNYNTPRKFIIRTAWAASRQVFVNQQLLSSDPTDDWSDECQLIREAITESSCSGYGRGGSIDYALKITEFDANLGSLYLHQFDLVVSTAEKDQIPLHPYSSRGMRELILVNDDGIMGKSRFQYGITVVDKEYRFGRKFINLAGEVFAIDPITDTVLADGVYFKTSGPVSETGLPGKERCLYLTYEQAKEKLGMWNSVEEAATLGNPKAIDDRVQRELNADTKRAEHEARLRRAEREEQLEIIKHEEERRQVLQRGLEARLKDERLVEEHRRNMESIHRKDDFESRSLSRKNTSELLKYAPAIIAAVGSLIILYSKQRN